MADQSKDTPPIVLAFASFVAVAALPDASPVTLPVRFPMNVVAVVVPDTLTFCKKVAFVLVLILSVTAIPVSADPSIAGKAPVSLEAAMVLIFALVTALSAIFDVPTDVRKPAPLVS